MKKIIILITFLFILTSCSEVQTKTVVVNKDGKVIETKVDSGYRLVPTGDFITVNNAVDMPVYQDTKTGCKYFGYTDNPTPLYDEYGHVEGCKKINDK